jgi:hypothetical protein
MKFTVLFFNKKDPRVGDNCYFLFAVKPAENFFAQFSCVDSYLMHSPGSAVVIMWILASVLFNNALRIAQIVT